MKHRFWTVALFTLLPLASSAEIYRWTDAQGGVHYAQTPPKGQAVETVRPAPPPASDGDNGLRKYAGELEKSRTQQERQQAEIDARKKDRDQRCAQVQQRMQALDQYGPHRLATKQANGEYERWTTERFDAERGKLQQAADQDCGH